MSQQTMIGMMEMTRLDLVPTARFIVASLLITSGFVTPAQAGVKNIEQTLPRYGQRGTTVEVEIQGTSIDDPREIIFFQPGIRAYDIKMAEQQPSRRGFPHGGYLDAAITCKFEIAPDCLPGEYPFRLLTATELSHLGTFHVSPFRTINEDQNPNDTLEQATPVTANVTINGELGNEPEDIYRVPVKAGQQVSVEVNSVRISDQNYGGSTLDLAARILNEEGNELAANDDNSLHIQDPIVSTIIDYDGEAFIVVRRSTATPAKTSYAVHIGTNRRPLVAFPAGGPAGTTQSFRMIGDPAGDFEKLIEIPQQTGLFRDFGDAPSPVLLRSSDFPNVVESDSGEMTIVTNREDSQSPQVALNGIIDSRNDTDSFVISVRKDQPLHVRVFASGLGSPIDPVLTIRDPEGKIELREDDAKLPQRDVFATSYRGGGGRPETIDPSIIWRPKFDGDYVLEISDLSGYGGPTGIYRVEIQQPHTVVQTVLASKTFDWTESTRFTGLAVPQGGRHTVNVTLPEGQWNSIPCEFDLIAEGLPNGVRLVAPRVKPGTTFWPVQFVADESAELGGAVITLKAKPVDPEVVVESRSQENIPFINHPGGDALHYVQVDRYIMGVVQPALFTIEIEQPQAALVRGGELEIPVKIARREGFEGPVEFSVRFVHSAVSFQPPTTIPPGETESVLRLSASPTAPLGEHPLAVIGRSLEDEIPRSMGTGDRLSSTEIVHFNIAEPYVELASQPESVRRGERMKFVWTVKHKTPFEGQAQVRLLGLPKGVSVVTENPLLTRESQQIAFEIEATPEALLGQVTGLGCEVVVTVAGREVTQRAGHGSLRIDPLRE